MSIVSTHNISTIQFHVIFFFLFKHKSHVLFLLLKAKDDYAHKIQQ